MDGVLKKGVGLPMVGMNGGWQGRRSAAGFAGTAAIGVTVRIFGGSASGVTVAPGGTFSLAQVPSAAPFRLVVTGAGGLGQVYGPFDPVPAGTTSVGVLVLSAAEGDSTATATLTLPTGTRLLTVEAWVLDITVPQP